MSETLRPPIVTILGHVDHGKTTLLDYIRKSNVASKERGGITQHIGAYQVQHQGKLITFIDTPGHAAFEKMRSRGAQVADISILVVALNDGVMPQTVEAINHIKDAKTSLIVAINKIDLPEIDVNVQLQKIKKQLTDREINLEEYGGDTPVVSISAKTGEGVDKLLEMINVVSELQELKGDNSKEAQGVVIESNLDKFKGSVATILIRDGSLKKGDTLLIDGVKSKVRGMFDARGKPVSVATPSMPVEVLGLESVPPVGSVIGKETTPQQAAQAPDWMNKLQFKKSKTLKLVIKTDKQGSLEAIEHALEKHNKEEKVVEFIYKGTGDITEENIKLASAVGAIIVGFNVEIRPQAQKMAENEKVLIRSYNVIYELIEEIEEVVEEMLKVGQLEEVFGRAEILAEFPYGKNERIAGCRMEEGMIARGQRIRVVREGEVIGETKLKALKKVKEDVNKVEKGNDCGMLFDPPLDFKIGDFVESFRVI